MSLKDIVVVNITRDSVRVTQKGFGVPLILGVHSKFPERIREYDTIEAVAEDFGTADLEYKKAVALFSQQITPEKVKIGRRNPNTKQKINITVPSAANNTSYKIILNGIEFEFVSGGTATAGSIVDGLIAAIGAGSEPVTTTDNGNDFDIEANTAGIGFAITTTANLAFTTTQENVSVVTEMQEVQSVDDDWYFAVITSQTEQDILQLAEYMETQKKIFFAISNDIGIKQLLAHIQTLTFDADFVTGNTIDLKINEVSITQVTFTTDHDTTLGLLAQAIQDSAKISTATVTGAREITVTGSTPGEVIEISDITVAGGASQAGSALTTTQDPEDNLASKLRAKSYDRTVSVYTEDTDNHIDTAWVGLNAAEDPGSITWAFKQLKGVVTDSLTDNEKSNIHKKNTNTYTEVAGVNITEKGTVASGEFIDIIRGTDFLQARMEERIFKVIATSKKVPYTNQGIDVFRSIVSGVLQLGIDQGILTDNPAPVVTAPDVLDVDEADKLARVLRNVKFTATYAGAIHKVTVQGNISV
jgi:hypothetical protein